MVLSTVLILLFQKHGNQEVHFNIIPDIRWAFSREKLMWGLYSDYSFNKIKNRRVFLRMGIKSTDISTGGGY